MYAYKHFTLLDVTFLYYFSPFIIALFSHFLLKEKTGKYQIISILFGFIGILLIIKPGMIAFTPVSLIMLSGVIAFSYANIISRQIGKDEPSINFTLYPTLMTVIITVPFMIINPILPPAPDLTIMAVGGLMGSLAIMVIAMAYVRTHAVTVSIFGYTDVIWSALIGYLLFGDILTDRLSLLGGTIIILSGAYMLLKNSTLKTQ